MSDPIDAETDRLIRYLLAKAHLMAAWEAPRVSKRAEILKNCAEQLRSGQPMSEFDRLMQ